MAVVPDFLSTEESLLLWGFLIVYNVVVFFEWYPWILTYFKCVVWCVYNITIKIALIKAIIINVL